MVCMWYIIVELEPKYILSCIGSCAAAGYSECCVDEDGETDCLGGDPFDCYCDQFCYFLDDCCYDINDICIPPTPEGKNRCTRIVHAVNSIAYIASYI